MRLLRYFLTAVSIIPAVAILIVMKMEARSLDPPEIAVGFGAAILLFLNAYYIIEHPPFANRPLGRLGRWVSLWMQAKEQDLEKRANVNPAGSQGSGSSA